MNKTVKKQVPTGQELIEKIKSVFIRYRAFVKKRGEGILKYDYLVPGGPSYPEQWDWDGFYTGVALAADIPSEAIFLRNWALNYIINAKKDGKIAGTLTPKGWDTRIHQMKPFLAQGAYLSSKFLNDYSWIKHHWNKFLKIVTYRERNFWNKKYDLGFWFNHMESGADNNVALILYPEKSVIATDLNTFVCREYKAVSLLAEILNKKKEAEHFGKRAGQIKKNINKYLWDDKSEMYCNVYIKTGEFIKRVNYSTFVPLFGRIASQKQAAATIKRYMLSDKYLNTPYGLTSLAKNDPSYNNINFIKPYSNWQGPIWPNVNYVYMQGMLNYGFTKEAMELSKKISNLLLKDIAAGEGPHENYDAETGKPMAAPHMVGWNLLVANMIEEVINQRNPFDII